MTGPRGSSRSCQFLLGVPILITTYSRFPLTPLAYRLVFIPAILAREILLRCKPLTRGGWLFFLVTSVCLAPSACYEFIEWWAALLGGEAADAFLGTQGDVWDTQWDMFLALVGAITAQVLLSGIHDAQLKRLEQSRKALGLPGGEVS